MSRSTVEILNAFLDGELPANEAAQIERRLGEEAELRQLHDELLAVRSGLKVLPQFRLGLDFAASVIRAAKQAMREQQEATSLVALSPVQTVEVATKSIFARQGQVFGWLAVAAAAVLVLIFYAPQRTTFQVGQQDVIAQSNPVPVPIIAPSGGGGLESPESASLRVEPLRNEASGRPVEELQLKQNFQMPVAAHPARAPEIAEKGAVIDGLNAVLAKQRDSVTKQTEPATRVPASINAKSLWRESAVGGASAVGVADADSSAAAPSGLLVVNIDVTVEAVKLGVLDRFMVTVERDRANLYAESDEAGKAPQDQPAPAVVRAAGGRFDDAAKNGAAIDDAGKFAKEESADLKKADAKIDGIVGGELAGKMPAKDQGAEHTLAIRDGRIPSTLKVVRYAAEADVRVFEVVAEPSQLNELIATLQSQSPQFSAVNRAAPAEKLSTFSARGAAEEGKTKGDKKLDSEVKNLAEDEKSQPGETRRKAMANSPLPVSPKSPMSTQMRSTAGNPSSAAGAAGGLSGAAAGPGVAPTPAYKGQADKPTVEKAVPAALPAAQFAAKPAEDSPTQVRALLVFRIVPSPLAASPAETSGKSDATSPPAGK